MSTNEPTFEEILDEELLYGNGQDMSAFGAEIVAHQLLKSHKATLKAEKKAMVEGLKQRLYGLEMHEVEAVINAMLVKLGE